MTSSVVLTLLVTLAGAAIITLMAKATNKEVPVNENGQILLRMHWAYKLTAIVCFLFTAAFLVIPFIDPAGSAPSYIALVFMLLMFGGFTILCWLFYKKHYVLFDDTSIEVHSALGKTTTMRWDEINDASFNLNSGLLTLTTKSGQKAGVHHHLAGFPKFLDYFERKTRWSAWQFKIPDKR